MGHLLGYLGWVDYDVPPSCPDAAQPVLHISHQPKQNQAEGGTTKIKVNQTQLSEQMPLLVSSSLTSSVSRSSYGSDVPLPRVPLISPSSPVPQVATLSRVRSERVSGPEGEKRCLALSLPLYLCLLGWRPGTHSHVACSPPRCRGVAADSETCFVNCRAKSRATSASTRRLTRNFDNGRGWRRRTTAPARRTTTEGRRSGCAGALSYD